MTSGVMPTFFFQAEDGIRDRNVTGVQTCALPIYQHRLERRVEEEQILCGEDSDGRTGQEEHRPEVRAGPVAAHPEAVGDTRGHHDHRSEERRVGKECRSRMAPLQDNKTQAALSTS